MLDEGALGNQVMVTNAYQFRRVTDAPGSGASQVGEVNVAISGGTCTVPGAGPPFPHRQRAWEGSTLLSQVPCDRGYTTDTLGPYTSPTAAVTEWQNAFTGGRTDPDACSCWRLAQGALLWHRHRHSTASVHRGEEPWPMIC